MMGVDEQIGKDVDDVQIPRFGIGHYGFRGNVYP
jgi:hypothetical protein